MDRVWKESKGRNICFGGRVRRFAGGLEVGMRESGGGVGGKGCHLKPPFALSPCATFIEEREIFGLELHCLPIHGYALLIETEAKVTFTRRDSL